MELTIVATRHEITHAHHLGTQSVVGNVIEHCTLSQELGVDIMVVEVLVIILQSYKK